ncbi:hypothetical protein [Rhodanobacter terrae]|uniref:Uncharacterized protein n=1 Tax=Rhodanobacter terrae TaxID=418647 RepID=A0ABW0T2Z6_9GAMM
MTEQTPLQQLRDLLNPVPESTFSRDQHDEIESLLACCWDQLVGGSDGGMKAEKLSGRIENMTWSPPQLTFEIERHGGVVLGSKRAEMQKWAVDVEHGTATCTEGRARQLYPNTPKLNVVPIAEDIAGLISNGTLDPRIRWIGANLVKVEIGKIIPMNSPKDTVRGRRDRLKVQLAHNLSLIGWYPRPSSAPWTFERQSPTGPLPSMVTTEKPRRSH